MAGPIPRGFGALLPGASEEACDFRVQGSGFRV